MVLIYVQPAFLLTTTQLPYCSCCHDICVPTKLLLQSKFNNVLTSVQDF